MARVTGVRSVELGVRDLNESIKFYSDVWGLEIASTEGETIHMRGTGTEHHVVSMRQTGNPTLLGVHFAANDRVAVDAMCGKAKATVSTSQRKLPRWRRRPAAVTASASSLPMACR